MKIALPHCAVLRGRVLASLFALFVAACAPFPQGPKQGGDALPTLAATPTPPVSKQVLADVLNPTAPLTYTTPSVPALRQSFARSCQQFSRQPAEKALHSNPIFGTYGQWQAFCAQALQVSDANFLPFLASTHKPVKLEGERSLFTGYFQPEYPASLVPTATFSAPLRPFPKGYAKSATLPPRAEVESGALGNATAPIAYLTPVDKLFLQIQGSGTLILPDGTRRHVAYDGKNNQPYTAIGKVLREEGALPAHNITMQSIRRWLEANPRQQQRIINHNQSYIFFNWSQTAAPGAFGVPLTPLASVAVDREFVPLGVPLLIHTIESASGQPLRAIMLAQDVGSAIKGPVRGDIYFGSGAEAGHTAGKQNAPGQKWALVLDN